MPTSFEIETPRDHLDLEFCLTSGQVFRWRKLDDSSWVGVDGDHWYRVVVTDDRLDVQSNAEQSDFESLFRLDWNAEDVDREITRKAPELAPYLAALKGHRLMRPSDPVETFFSFLCTPNNNIKRITQMAAKLASRGPVLAEIDGQRLHRFPEAERIADIPEADLRSEGFGYRAATIPALARELVKRGGRSYLENLSKGPYEDAKRDLLTMHGIGRKLADCVCLFALHHDEAVPIDTHIWQAMTRLYFPEWKGQALTDKRYETAAEFFRNRLGNLAGWAHQYLFYENVLNWRSRA